MDNKPEHSTFWAWWNLCLPAFYLFLLSSQLIIWVLKTGAVYNRKNTNVFIPAIPEGRLGAERFPAQWCRFKRFRYTSDKQPQLGVNHTCLELQSLMYLWKDCHLLSDEIQIQHMPNKLEVSSLVRACSIFVCSAHLFQVQINHIELLCISNIFMYTYFSASAVLKLSSTWELQPGWYHNAPLLACFTLWHFHPELPLLLASSSEHRSFFHLFEALCTFFWCDITHTRSGHGESKKELSLTMKKSI